MTVTNITDLPDEVLRSEFPQIWIDIQRQRAAEQSNSDKTNIFLDQDNNQFYLQKDGSNKATRYNLLSTNKSLKHPELPESTTLNMDRTISDWGTLDDQSIFDKTNKNWDEIRSYFEAMTRKINMFTEYLNALGPYLDKLAEEKDVDLSEVLANQTDTYFKKSEINSEIESLQSQIDNLSNAITYKPAPGGVFPPSYTGDKDIDVNDKIYDPNVAQKIDELNSLYDEKGDNNQ